MARPKRKAAKAPTCLICGGPQRAWGANEGWVLHKPEDCIASLKEQVARLAEATQTAINWDEQRRRRLHEQQYEIHENAPPLTPHSRGCRCCFCGLRRALPGRTPGFPAVEEWWRERTKEARHKGWR